MWFHAAYRDDRGRRLPDYWSIPCLLVGSIDRIRGGLLRTLAEVYTGLLPFACHLFVISIAKQN